MARRVAVLSWPEAGVIGEELGNYRVLAPIGRGGMASVYVGEHKVLQNRVAIKVLQKRHLDNPAIERRFLNEAKAIAAIRHANIVEIYDFGRAGDGCAYIVMELLEGETLRERIRRGVMPERQSMIFAKQLASALAAAHREGVIHRDLKPDNVFIIADEEVELGERIKLLDFGIAKRIENPGPVSEQTATGILVGTPAYMSPEQCRGQANIDGRSDIYSLGVVLYRMVTNQLPFEGQGTGELIGKHLYIEPPSPRELNAAISTTLEAIIGRCLEKEPDDRFQTMSELASTLAEATKARTLPRSGMGPQEVLHVMQPNKPTAIEPIAPAPDPIPIEETPTPAPAPPVVSPEEMPPAFQRARAGRRPWTVYAGIGSGAVALLIGVIAMNAGGSDPTAPAAAAPGESAPALVDAFDEPPEAAIEEARREAAIEEARRQAAEAEAAEARRAADEAEAARRLAETKVAEAVRRAEARARARQKAREIERRRAEVRRRRADRERRRAAAEEAAEKKKVNKPKKKTGDVPIHY